MNDGRQFPTFKWICAAWIGVSHIEKEIIQFTHWQRVNAEHLISLFECCLFYLITWFIESHDIHWNVLWSHSHNIVGPNSVYWFEWRCQQNDVIITHALFMFSSLSPIPSSLPFPVSVRDSFASHVLLSCTAWMVIVASARARTLFEFDNFN